MVLRLRLLLSLVHPLVLLRPQMLLTNPMTQVKSTPRSGCVSDSNWRRVVILQQHLRLPCRNRRHRPLVLLRPLLKPHSLNVGRLRLWVARLIRLQLLHPLRLLPHLPGLRLRLLVLLRLAWTKSGLSSLKHVHRLKRQVVSLRLTARKSIKRPLELIGPSIRITAIRCCVVLGKHRLRCTTAARLLALAGLRLAVLRHPE